MIRSASNALADSHRFLPVNPDAKDRAPEPLTLSVTQAVAATGLSRTTLYQAIGDGRLRSRRVAGRRLIDAASLRRFVLGDAA